MKSYEAVSELLKKRGGYLTAKEAREVGVPNKDLQRLTARGNLERAAHGLYISEDVFPDTYYIAQYRCPQGVFSHETALFIHGLCDRVPVRLMMTIPSGWNTSLLKDESFKFFYCGPEKMGLGVCEIEMTSGVKVRTYNIERTLCDCIKYVDQLDRDLIITGLKRYVKREEKDSAKLLDYASLLNVRDIVYRYLEVLF